MGDHEGHKFHGNQYVDEGEGGGKDKDKDDKKRPGVVMVDHEKGLKRDTRLFNTLFNPTKDQRKAMKQSSLFARLDALELAVVALARAEFGDIMGHIFHGNQWTHGGDVTVREHKYDEDKVVVLKQGQKIGSVTQVGGFSDGKTDIFEAHTPAGEKTRHVSASDAVQHVIDKAEEDELPVAASG